ncbi:hypothetical protein GGR51DRAFT_533145 [Nemania sp. FL0031]|nr:hypothetical protein GGR51DRAFT_533145 [Nemania sp. FL0031]
MGTINATIQNGALGRVVPPTDLSPSDLPPIEIPPIELDNLDHDDFGPSVEACIWALVVLATGWLALRLYLKYCKHRGLWWDDYVLIISWVCLVLSNTATSVAIALGWGKEPYDVPPSNPPMILLALLISGAFSILAASISKTSFALTLLRISNGWVKCVIWFAICTINTAMGLSVIFNWVQCTPVQKNFYIFTPGTCWPKTTLIQYNAFAAGYSGAVDIMLALLPWKIIWKMNMTRKERFGAICAMSLGLFAGIVSIVKIYALIGTFQANIDNSVQLTILSVAETAITIMAASIPILRALARDKAGPGGVKLFTLNVTEHLTLRRQSEPQIDVSDVEASKADRASRRLFRLVRKPSARRAPVLSDIIEAEELPQELTRNSTTAERSFV